MDPMVHRANSCPPIAAAHSESWLFSNLPHHNNCQPANNVQWRKERSKYSTVTTTNESEGNVSESNSSVDSTTSEYMGGVEELLFVDAKRGQGTHAITRAVYKAGRHVNERRTGGDYRRGEKRSLYRTWARRNN